MKVEFSFEAEGFRKFGLLWKLIRNGVQLFIATHSYNLAKYFELKSDYRDVVEFHNLYRTAEGVKSQREKYLDNIGNNPIIEAELSF